MSTPHGFLLLDRHIEKNAGSTFREILFANERRGKCMYWGYQQRSVAWDGVLNALYNLSTTAVPPRLCVEAHSHIDHVTPWVRRLEQLQELRRHLQLHAVRLKVVLQLRLREPLSHYISYYLWTVVERQDRAPERFGHTFEEWVRKVPNLQTELVISSKAAFTASFAPNGHRDLEAWRAHWANAEQAAERRTLALRVVNSFDVLGTTERFDETTLLIARELNWSASELVPPPKFREQAPQPAETCMLRRRLAGERIPWWCRIPGRSPSDERRRVHKRVCPNVTACAELVRLIAPVDHELYALANHRLDKAIALQRSSFSKQLDEMRRLNKLTVSPNPPRCMWRPMRPPAIASPRMERNGRRAIFAIAPNFSSVGTAGATCVPGDPAVMKQIWAEHRQGGRASPGWPIGVLIPMQGRGIGKRRRHGNMWHTGGVRVHAST